MKKIRKIFSLFLFSYSGSIYVSNIKKEEIVMSKIDKNHFIGINFVKFNGKSNLSESVNGQSFCIQHINNIRSKATIRIRDMGTYKNDPLYFINDIPIKSGMHELSSNDIESFQVLKDGGSPSIYGFLAANGVIIITNQKVKMVN